MRVSDEGKGEVRLGVGVRALMVARAMLSRAILTTARPTCSMCALGCGAPRWMLCGGGRG